MPRLNPDPKAIEARRIAKAAGLVVFEKPHQGGTLFRIARKLPNGTTTHLGTRATPEALRAYVCKLAGAH